MPATNDNPFLQLFTTSQPASLGPDKRSGVMDKDELIKKIEVIAQGSGLVGERRALVCSILLLWHDHLDASHELSQGIASPDGSFLHAMMHRREPDYWNSKYWWRRVGNHPAFGVISKRAGEFLDLNKAGDVAKQLLPAGFWDACAFVDACEAAEKISDDVCVKILRELQRIEFQVMLESFVRDDK